MAARSAPDRERRSSLTGPLAFDMEQAGWCSQVRMIASASAGCAVTTSPTFLMEELETWPSMRLISMLGAGGGRAIGWAPSAPGACAAAGAASTPAIGEALAMARVPEPAAVWAANMRLIRGLATNRPIKSAVRHMIAASMILNQ